MTSGESPLPLEYDAERGRLSLGAHPYLLIRPQTLAPLYTRADPTLLQSLEAGGREGGRLAAASVLARGLRGREAFETLLAMGGQIGWGRMTLLAWTPEIVRVQVRHSPFAEVARGSEGPVCHITRGVLAGMLAQLFDGAAAETDETACEAAGAGACRFEVRR
jgi:predicted hydrocarbon binding protein